MLRKREEQRRRKPQQQGLGKALPNKIPMGQNERTANYGTSVESCSVTYALPLPQLRAFLVELLPRRQRCGWAKPHEKGAVADEFRLLQQPLSFRKKEIKADVQEEWRHVPLPHLRQQRRRGLNDSFTPAEKYRHKSLRICVVGLRSTQTLSHWQVSETRAQRV